MEVVKVINHHGKNYNTKESLKRHLENELGALIDNSSLPPKEKLLVFELLTGSHSVSIASVITDLKNLSNLKF